jgi:prolyl-tRNA editing enzyme YbaK/EbsC (Cys-tRNA(Pro) deacylase)
MSGADRFDAAVRRLGFTANVQRFPEGTKTAQDAARAVGCDVDQIVKSLVFVTDGRAAILCLTSGRHRADLGKLAALSRSAEVHRATPEEARAATGFAIGGTPPFGHPEPLATWIDETFRSFETVWAAAGAPDRVFPIDPETLAGLSGGTWADIAEGT